MFGLLQKNMVSDMNIDESKITLKKAGPNDMRELFNWRNHLEARRNSFNTNAVEWGEHKKWFKIKTKDPNTSIYIACLGSYKIGSVRFEHKRDVVAISIILNPDFFGKRLAAKVIRLATERFIKEKGREKAIVAEIKRENIASIKAFQKAGFRESHVTYVFNKNRAPETPSWE
jgi:RimJ/RimL family protein N-acetyltransferase